MDNFHGPMPYWVNIYGAPIDVKRGKYAKMMNRYPDKASTFRGSVLLQLRTETDPSPDLGNRPFRRLIQYEMDEDLLPKTVRYTLRAHILQGSEIPIFKFPNSTGSANMKIIVSIGCLELKTNWASNHKGIIDWNELLEEKGIELPEDIEQLPDVFIYLVRGPDMASSTVCFARIKIVDLISSNFQQQPYWLEFETDRSRTGTLAGISEFSYPGSLLLQIGFGRDELAYDVNWKKPPEMKDEFKAVALRAKIYQAKNLPAYNNDGLLDPYCKCRFMGEKKKTKTQKSTTDPLFYETLEFHDLIPIDLIYAPEIICEIWDRDTVGTNKQVARCRIPLTEARSPQSMLGHGLTPVWRKLKSATGREIEAELLIGLEIIYKSTIQEKIGPAPSITPHFRECFLEIISLGVRDLAPYNFQQISQPYVVFELQTPKGRMKIQTHASKFPSGRDANYLLRSLKRVYLPEDPLYSPQMQIKVYDQRLGGLSSPLIGVSNVRVATKMPWHTEEYIPPQSQVFGGNQDDITNKENDDEYENFWKKDNKIIKKIEKENESDFEDEFSDDELERDRRKRAGERIGKGYDDNSDSDEEEKLSGTQSAIKKMNKDTGTGVFPSMDLKEMEEGLGLAEIKEETIRKEVLDERNRSDSDDSKGWWESAEFNFNMNSDELDNILDLDIDIPKGWVSAEYTNDRDWWINDEKNGGGELENFLKTSPFENYLLYRGNEREKSQLFGFGTTRGQLRKVGIFKGIISITTEPPHPKKSDLIDLKLFQTKEYLLRLYVVKADHLQPKDLNGLADPFLKVKVGSYKHNDKKNRILKTLQPDFYRMFEIPCKIPGESLLTISVFDYDRFSTNELIGENVIDLEDRWFHPIWQELGNDSEKVKTTGPPKPLEHRDLWIPSSTNPQGQVQLWVEILSPALSKVLEPEEFAPPEPMTVELRVICWRSRDVVSMDDLTGLNDLYGKFWLESNAKKKHTTDTHWRCKNGRGSWNYRLKFKVDLPLNSLEEGRLSLQLWDRDILKWNDMIAEASIDLYRWFQMCYHKKDSVKPFKEIKDAMDKKKRKAEIEEHGPRLVENEDVDDYLNSKNDNDDIETGIGTNIDVEMGNVNNNKNNNNDENSSLLNKDNQDDENDETKPLLSDEEIAKKKKEMMKNRKYGDESKEFLNQVKDLMGMGDIAEDAQWLRLTKTDHARGFKEVMGDLAISIEILPWEQAQANMVGKGRGEPNQNPYLPPPVGRMTLSLNPFKMLYELLGPRGCFKLACLCLCICLFIAFYFIGQYVSSLEAFF